MLVTHREVEGALKRMPIHTFFIDVFGEMSSVDLVFLQRMWCGVAGFPVQEA
jgi:hypothetical protein